MSLATPCLSAHRGGCRTLAMAAVTALLGGCVANSSNPIVSVTESRLSCEEALIDLELANPGGRDLRVSTIEYQLSHGEMAFPIAEGVWEEGVELPASTQTSVRLRIPLLAAPLEADSRVLHLSGALRLIDRTGFLGIRSMNMSDSPFQLRFEASADAMTVPAATKGMP
jgi:hypothetical protein